MELQPDAGTHSQRQRWPGVDSSRRHFVAPLLLSQCPYWGGGEGGVDPSKKHLQLMSLLNYGRFFFFFLRLSFNGTGNSRRKWLQAPEIWNCIHPNPEAAVRGLRSASVWKQFSQVRNCVKYFPHFPVPDYFRCQILHWERALQRATLEEKQYLEICVDTYLKYRF